MDCQLEGRRFQHKLAGTLPGQELQYQAAILEQVLASERQCWSSKSFSSLDFPVTRAGAPAEAPLKHTLAACLPAGSFRFHLCQQTQMCLANHRASKAKLPGWVGCLQSLHTLTRVISSYCSQHSRGRYENGCFELLTRTWCTAGL